MNDSRRLNAGRLIIVSGLPATGKTMLARQLERGCPGVRFCPDEWMAERKLDLCDEVARHHLEQLQWQLAQRLLVLGATAIIEWGTWARSKRDALRERARELGAAVELRFLDAPPEVLWRRVRDRDMERRLGHRALTPVDMSNYQALIERPDVEELALYDVPSA